MTNPETKARGGCLAVAILVAVLLLPPAYFLSIGPAIWLCGKGYLPPSAYRATSCRLISFFNAARR